MASMRDIKRRKESIQSTGQITKAMKLVATVKLQKAKARAEDSQPYFKEMYRAVKSILKKSSNLNHPYLNAQTNGKKGVILITSNRGLAGGYNSNIIKLVTAGGMKKEDVLLYTVGRKGRDSLVRKGYELAVDYPDAIDEPLFSDASEIGKQVLSDFTEGKIGEIYLAYTEFKNTVSHIPKLIRLLPVSLEEAGENADEQETEDAMAALTPMNYEPEAEEAIELIIPKYVNSLIYGGLLQAAASENGARMQAMDSATNNADEMISDLSLMYNRARQSSITQELTEIIAGANAIS